MDKSDLIGTIIDKLGEGVCVLSREGKVIYANERAAALIGRDRSRLEDLDFFGLIRLPASVTSGEPARPHMTLEFSV